MPFDFEGALRAGNTPQQITNYLTSKGRAVEAHAYFDIPEKPGFIQRVGEDLKKHGASLAQTFKETASGKINPLDTGLQTVGAIAGGVNDVIGEGIKSGINAIPQGIKNIAKNVGVVFLQTPVGQAGLSAIQQGVEKYNQWKAENPVGAKNLESIINIASLFPIGKGGQIAKEGLESAGKKVLDVGVEVASKTGTGMIKTGEAIQNVVLKPSTIDLKNGFKLQNITKYGLNGTLDEMLPKTVEKIKSLSTNLQDIIQGMGKEPVINLKGVLEELKSGFSGKGLKVLGSKQSIENTISNIKRELKDIMPNWETTPITFSDAIEAKRAAGLNASFLHGQIKQGLTADEQVWNSLYRILQKETERVAKGTKFELVNKQISELIPIQQAIIRRIPVADRNNLLSLPDLIAGIATVSNPKALTIGIVNRALKSGTVAKYLVKAGEKLVK